jgi:hypothetical protein
VFHGKVAEGHFLGKSGRWLLQVTGECRIGWKKNQIKLARLKCLELERKNKTSGS